MFGSTSERIALAKLTQPSIELDLVKAPESEQKHMSAIGVRHDRSLLTTPRMPENLPVINEVIESEPVKENPQDRRRIGEELSGQLECEPGRFIGLGTIRTTNVKRKNSDLAPSTASLPPKLLDRCLVASGLIAHVASNRICEHTLLYNQQRVFRSYYQVNLTSLTLNRWLRQSSDWLAQVYQQIRTGVMSGGYAQVDETTIDYLEPGNARAKQGYLWVGKDLKVEVFFKWESRRSADCMERLVPSDLHGAVLCDGYK